jgi:sugar O-acyltransferase (sialic acid O-acetyltransferase NeuD family)
VNKPDLLLIGAGGHARSCIDVIESDGQFRIAGLIGVAEEVGAKLMGYEVLATDDDLPELALKFEYALITVGQIKCPKQRIQLHKRALDCGFLFPAITSNNARVSRYATVAPGTIVMHGAVVNAGAVVGSNCILNTNSVIEHDVVLGDFSHVSTGSIVNGDTRIGEGSFIGSGSIIKEGLSLGMGCVVGMGSCVRHDLEEGAQFPRPEFS